MQEYNSSIQTEDRRLGIYGYIYIYTHTGRGCGHAGKVSLKRDQPLSSTVQYGAGNEDLRSKHILIVFLSLSLSLSLSVCVCKCVCCVNSNGVYVCMTLSTLIDDRVSADRASIAHCSIHLTQQTVSGYTG